LIPFSEELSSTFIGKMFINSLNDLTRITSSGPKQMTVDELNDFAEKGIYNPIILNDFIRVR
jgi:hypothetical protein